MGDGLTVALCVEDVGLALCKVPPHIQFDDQI